MGDLVLVIDDETMKRGVRRDIPVTLDIEDKITSLEEKNTLDNRVKVVLRDKSNMIGEISNYATAYHNRIASSDEMKSTYESYIDLLSIANGKCIDYAKTGVMYSIPRYIAKHGRPLPYFMRFASPYYFNMKSLSRVYSNMNRLCFEIEDWHRSHKWKRKSKRNDPYQISDRMNVNFYDRQFDYTIMLDKSIPVDEYKLNQIKDLFLQYYSESDKMLKDHQAKLEKVANRKDNSNYEYVDDINWQAFYNSYRLKAFNICSDICELANYAVMVCYELYPKRKKRFMWTVGGEGILCNLKQSEQLLPIRDPNGEYEYLGNHFRMEKIIFD